MEKNENSPAYIKITINQHLEQRTMPMLKHLTRASDCNDTESKLDAVHSFYSSLYTADRIDINSLEVLINQITKAITTEESDQLISAISLDKILEGTR